MNAQASAPANDLVDPAHAVFPDAYGRKLVRFAVEALPDRQLRIDASALVLPGLGMISGRTGGCRLERSQALLADGNDDLRLVVNRGAADIVRQRDREIVLAAGEAVLLSCAEPIRIVRPVAGRFLALQLPLATLSPLVGNITEAVMRRIPRDSAALRLLMDYVGVLENRSCANPEIGRLVAVHILDLVVLAIGAIREHAARADGRGGRAARLRAIKIDIATNLDHDVSIGAMARRHRLDKRYIQRLFEHDGTTYSQFVMNQRLARAHRMLGDPRLSATTIGDIAGACGFDDQPYFNRRFRELFDACPSQVRAAASAAPEMVQAVPMSRSSEERIGSTTDDG